MRKFCNVAGCKPAFLQILNSVPNVFLRISRNYRGSRHPEVLCKKGILKYFEKMTGKHQSLFCFCCRSGLAIFLEKRLRHRCAPVNLAKFLRTAFLIEHLHWLLRNVIEQYFCRTPLGNKCRMYRTKNEVFH